MENLFLLSDSELLERLPVLARAEREATAEVIEHLVEVERRRLYLEQAWPNLVAYCRDRLGYAEDAAYKRARVAEVAIRFPRALHELRSGALHLTALLLLSSHLTDDNAAALLTEARGKSRRDIEALLARRFPRRPAPAEIRPVPPAGDGTGSGSDTPSGPSTRNLRSGAEPVSQFRLETQEEDYRFTFTASAAFRRKVERARELASHAVPSGDVAEILERALDLFIAHETKRRPPPGAVGLQRIPPPEVRWIFSFDRGGCSKRVWLDASLQKIVETVTSEFRRKVEKADPPFASTEAHANAVAQSAVWAGASNGPVFFNAEGGFQLSVEADVKVTGLVMKTECALGFCVTIPITVDKDAAAHVVGRYRWRIEDTLRENVEDDRGLVTVEPLDVTRRSGHDNTEGWIGIYTGPAPLPTGPHPLPVDSFPHTLQKSLREEMPGGVKEAAAEYQIVEILGVLREPDPLDPSRERLKPGPPVPCDTANDCVIKRELTSEVEGAEGSLELAAKLASTVVPELTGQEDAFRAIFKDPAQWRCQAIKPATEKTCRMLVRGRRINTYPDFIEVVIREAGEWPITRETLIEVLLMVADRFTPGSNLRTERMCDAPEHGKRWVAPFVKKDSAESYD